MNAFVLAHGLSGRADLPIPQWLFTWVAAGILVISFVSLARLWRRPRLENYEVRPLPRPISRVLTSRATDIACGAFGVFLLGVVVWAGFTGVQTAVENVVPTFVYVIFWVGLVFASVLFGDVFRAFNPWRAIGRTASWAAGHVGGGRLLSAPPPYPDWLGRWPAAAGLVAFVWLELASPSGVEPKTIAAAALVYSSLTFLGMGLFGIEAWTSRGEAFSVYFGLFARLSVFERRGAEIVLRPPLAGLTTVELLPGTVALLAVMIGTVTFDGFQETNPWSEVGPRIAEWLTSIGLGPALADELTAGIGILGAIAVIAGFYLLGIKGARTVGGGVGVRFARGPDEIRPLQGTPALRAGVRFARGPDEIRPLQGMPALRAGVLPLAFVHALVPIAVVYVASHYLTFMLFQGQAMGYLLSNPLGEGWDLFGTAGWTIDYGLIGGTVTWYVQVAFVVAGHLSGLALAHDRALIVYRDPEAATRSQAFTLIVMVGFTSLALWLLSQANA